MRAVVLRSPGCLETVEVADPAPGAADVIVRVAAAGVCGSDLASYQTGAHVRPGQVMGHEFAGTVIEAGADVFGLPPGTRVTVRPTTQCGTCTSCRSGRTAICDYALRPGIGYGLPGAFAELVRVPNAVAGDNVFALPAHVSDTAGAFVEPLAVSLRAVRRGGVEPDDAVVVLGLGPIGLGVVQVLRALGVARIIGVDASAFRRRMALDMGAIEAVEADASEQAAARVAGPGPRGKHAGADVVIEASGSAVLLSGATWLLRSGGRIVMVALHKANGSLNVNDIVGREIDVVGCFGYDGEFAETLQLLSHNTIDAERMVTHVFPLAEATAAFAAQAEVEQHVKVQISPSL